MNSKRYMQEAIDEARKSKSPFGAILVIGDEVVAQSSTTKPSEHDPTAHAELRVIQQATSDLKTRNLGNCTLYSTCEPCPMCFTAAWWANIPKIVFGITLKESSELFVTEMNITASQLNEAGGNTIELQGGVLRDRILDLYDEVNQKRI